MSNKTSTAAIKAVRDYADANGVSIAELLASMLVTEARDAFMDEVEARGGNPDEEMPTEDEMLAKATDPARVHCFITAFMDGLDVELVEHASEMVRQAYGQ